MERLLDRILQGNTLTVLRSFREESINCCITSPPYWGLRNYDAPDTVWDGNSSCEHDWSISAFPRRERHEADVKNQDSKQATKLGANIDLEATRSCAKCGAWRGQLGLEPTPELYVQHLVTVFREVKRVLRKDGTLWLNLGDTYASSWGSNRQNKIGNPSRTERQIKMGDGLKEKDLVGIPWRVAFALQADGWWLRSDIIWAKPNPMPESVTDRPTKSHEYVFLLSKSADYYYDMNAIREPNHPDNRKVTTVSPLTPEIHGRTEGERWPNPAGRNKRTVWTVNTQPYPEAHFATFPEALVEPMVKAGCPEWVCGTCGKPRERISEQVGIRKAHGAILKYRGESGLNSSVFATNEMPIMKTVGWTDCGHNNYQSGVVLDPFCGSGTTCLVAAKLNRNWIGIDLSEKYCAMARERVAPYATKLSDFVIP